MEKRNGMENNDVYCGRYVLVSLPRERWLIGAPCQFVELVESVKSFESFESFEFWIVWMDELDEWFILEEMVELEEDFNVCTYVVT